jgi:hypothetical protein
MSDYDDDVEEVEDEEEPRPAAVRRVPRPATKLPISEVETKETLHGEVRFTISSNMGQRDENRHLSIAMPYPVQPHWTPEERAAAAADTAFQVKALGYEQAGIEFSIDEGGVIHEVIRKAFPGTRAVDPTEKLGAYGRRLPPEEREERQPRQDDGEFPHPRDLTKPGHVSRELWEDLVDTYDNEDWYDNRPRKDSGEYKATAADFKRVSDSTSIWLKPFKREGGPGGKRPVNAGRRGYDR